MQNKKTRVRKEMQNLFSDPRFARKAWQAVGQAVLQRPAIQPQAFLDKDGNETLDSLVERYTYQQLAADVDAAGNSYEPTVIEMIMACQARHAMHNTAAAAFIRDTSGGKPLDESKIDQTVVNTYEQLSDEELEALAAFRASRSTSTSPEPTAPETSCNTEPREE